LEDGILDKVYQTKVTLTPGANYKFKVEARNSVGYSLPSQELMILCAQPPDQPLPPVTTRSESEVILKWDAPWNGGSDILSYTVSFMHSDGQTFTVDTSMCDGSLTEIIASRTCTIASTVFTQTPFNHAWGSGIYAKVFATNIKGISVESLSGNGAVILRIPDVPVLLANVPEITSATTIGLSWSDGVDNGGTAVIDYTLSYARVPNDYETLVVGLAD